MSNGIPKTIKDTPGVPRTITGDLTKRFRRPSPPEVWDDMTTEVDIKPSGQS